MQKYAFYSKQQAYNFRIFTIFAAIMILASCFYPFYGKQSVLE